MSKTAIIESVRALNLGRAQELLSTDPRLSQVTDRQGRNLLHLACSISAAELRGSPATQSRLANYLLDLGLDIDEPVGPDACTPLFFAVARARSHSLAKLLIRRGAEVTSAPGGALFAAGWWNDVKSLKLLISAGAPVDVVVGVTPFLASWCWRKFDAAKFLALSGADVNFRDKNGKTALHHGIDKQFDPALLKWLVKHGASPEIPDNAGVSATMKASRKRDQRFAAVLSC